MASQHQPSPADLSRLFAALGIKAADEHEIANLTSIQWSPVKHRDDFYRFEKIIKKSLARAYSTLSEDSFTFHGDQPRRKATRRRTISLTLSRVAHAFPLVTTGLIIDLKIKGIISSKALGGITQLPLVMQHTIFPSLIPDDESDLANNLKKLALVLNIDISILSATPKKKCKLLSIHVDELLQQAEQFVTAAMTSGLINNEIKIETLKSAGVLNSDGSLDLSVEACIAAANRFLSNGNKKYSQAIKACQESLASVPEN